MIHLDLIKKNFKNKKILITGHTGFKGSWLSLYLNVLHAKVYGISDSIPTNPSHYQKIKKIFSGDYRINLSNTKKCNSLINKIKPDYIFHLAAQSIVSKSKTHPIETISSNILGSANILNSVKKFKKKVTVLMITSDKVYKNNEWIWGYRENDEIGGEDMYSASKASTEIIINSFKNFIIDNSNVKIGIARAGNVIGGGDWTQNRIVPDIIKSWIGKKNLIINNPKSVRPWQHVLEPLMGYIVLSYYLSKNKDSFVSHEFNFGPSSNNTYNVNDLIKLISKNFKSLKIIHKKRNFKEHSLLRLDSSKALNSLGWKSILNFNEICSLTSNWYENFYFKNTPVLDYSISQIKDYLKKYENYQK